jgi:hypothetical protein
LVPIFTTMTSNVTGRVTPSADKLQVQDDIAREVAQELRAAIH